MKRLLLYGLPLLVVAVVIGYFVVKWKTDLDTPHYGIGEQLNSNKTGSAVAWYLDNEDWYLFVRDFKRFPNKPQFLCYMNYTSTQGSYDARWSKDGQMIAVYDGSALRFPEMKHPKWVIGYDWQRGQILHSQQITQAFTRHGGQGASHEVTSAHSPTPQEIQQFEPQKLNRDRATP
ncbi:hypothetical protein IAD21_03201 [Abditibacteriota bacterium]|nr:hypothetical protein IAD21_03201 [Abditibacteriota bacterium]